jgi:hypothetical protein
LARFPAALRGSHSNSSANPHYTCGPKMCSGKDRSHLSPALIRMVQRRDVSIIGLLPASRLGDGNGPNRGQLTRNAQTADLGLPEPRPPVELPILPHIVPRFRLAIVGGKGISSRCPASGRPFLVPRCCRSGRSAARYNCLQSGLCLQATRSVRDSLIRPVERGYLGIG